MRAIILALSCLIFVNSIHLNHQTQQIGDVYKVQVDDFVTQLGNSIMGNLAQMFVPACQSGFIRANNINIFNNLTQDITLVGFHLEEGSVNVMGATSLKPGESTSWIFVGQFTKKGKGAQRTAGVLSYQLLNDNKTSFNLNAFFDHPISTPNLAAANVNHLQNTILQNSQASINSGKYNLKDLYSKFESKSLEQPAVYFENSKKQTDWSVRQYVQVPNHNITVAVNDYESDYQGTQYHCYIQRLDLVIYDKNNA